MFKKLIGNTGSKINGEKSNAGVSAKNEKDKSNASQTAELPDIFKSASRRTSNEQLGLIKALANKSQRKISRQQSKAKKRSSFSAPGSTATR